MPSQLFSVQLVRRIADEFNPGQTVEQSESITVAANTVEAAIAVAKRSRPGFVRATGVSEAGEFYP